MRDGLLEDLRNPARGGGSDAFEAAEEIERLQRVLQVVYDWCGPDAPDWEEIERILNEADRK
jgi:hypothetical protein